LSKYTDPATNFKLIQASDSHSFTKRNMKIWDMLLNRLGLPDHLHEFVRGIYLSGNWEQSEWDEITLMRIARNLTPDDTIQLKIYNRLKKNSSKFFEWQDQQPFSILEREIINDHAQKYKTKAKYNFRLYDLVVELFNLPRDLSLKAIRGLVNNKLKDYPKIEKPPRGPKRRKIKSIARAYIRDAREIMELTGSPQLAAIEIDEENLGDKKIIDLAKSLLQIKDLDYFSG
jgi:hypothetical protein